MGGGLGVLVCPDGFRWDWMGLGAAGGVWGGGGVETGLQRVGGRWGGWRGPGRWMGVLPPSPLLPEGPAEHSLTVPW